MRAITIASERKPQFKHNKSTGAYILKEEKGGIN